MIAPPPTRFWREIQNSSLKKIELYLLSSHLYPLYTNLIVRRKKQIMTTKFYSSIASHLIQTKPLFYGLTSSNSRKNIKQTYYYYVNTNKSDIALFHRTTNLQLFMCIFKFNKSSNDILNDNFFFLKKFKMKLKNSNIHLGI